MQLNELKHLVAAQRAPEIEVHGIDPSIYLIYQCSKTDRAPLKNQDGSNLTFRSRSRAFDALRDIGVQRADFVHKSAFDEMVGVGDGTPTEHRESVQLQKSSND